MTVIDHTNGVVLPDDDDENAAELIAHLRKIEQTFNDHATAVGLPIRMDVKKLVRRLEDDDYGKFSSFFSRADDSGVLHHAQIITVINIIIQCLREPDKCGLVLGALQAGKTLTAIALQWLGPIAYILTSRKIRPVYLITSHTSHQDQTRSELQKFGDWYGDIELWFKSRSITLTDYQQMIINHDAHPMYREFKIFAKHPTLNTYRAKILGATSYEGDLVDDKDFLQRRVHGRQVGKIAEMAKKITADGIEPVFIIDEAQHGASDPEIISDSGNGRSVLRQILDETARQIGQIDGDYVRYIAFSATPFELFDVSANELPNVWRVLMTLSPNYTGFNYFGGEAIDPTLQINTPQCVSFNDFGYTEKLPLLAYGQFSFYAWALPHKLANPDKRFETWAKRVGYQGTCEDYAAKYPAAMKQVIMTCIKNDGEPIGVCVRLCNNNALTERFIAELDLDENEVEILPFFAHAGGSIKRFLHNRTRPDLPFVIFVTNRARMGDAFPKQVRYFIECPEKATTLNALLQGLLGRACGYDKGTTVILSSRNAGIIDEWVSTNGGHVYRGSQHTLPVALRRGPKTNMIRIGRDMDDPVVQAFWERIQTEVIDPNLEPGEHTVLKTRSRRNDQRGAPILTIAEELGLFEHLESPAVRERLYPEYVNGFKIVRRGEIVDGRIDKKTGKPRKESYLIREDGNVAFTFRHSVKAHRANRGRTDRARKTDGNLDPQINLEKYDPRTGKTIYEGIDLDKNHPHYVERENRVPGLFRPHMITFPLKTPVQEVIAASQQLPRYKCIFGRHMTDEQRDVRDNEEQAALDRREKRKRS